MRAVRVQSFAKWLTWLVALAMWAVVLLGIYILFFPSIGPVVQITDGSRYPSSLLAGSGQLAATAIFLPGLAVQFYGLFHLRRTFASAAQGAFFSRPAIDGFRHFAWAALWLVPVGVAQGSAMRLLMTSLDPSQPTSLTITFGWSQFYQLFIALLFLFVAQIFSVGHDVDEDAKAIL